MIKRPDLTEDQKDRFYKELKDIANSENVPMEESISWLSDIPFIKHIESKFSIKNQGKVVSMLNRLKSRDY